MVTWNKITWYSKLLSAIFIFGIFPVLVFTIGMKYSQIEKTIEDGSKPTLVHSISNDMNIIGSRADEGVACPTAITQIEINTCMNNTLLASEIELKDLVAKIEIENEKATSTGSSADFITNLTSEQERWLAKRDQDCKAELGPISEGGSIYPAILADCKTTAIKERIAELKVKFGY